MGLFGFCSGRTAPYPTEVVGGAAEGTTFGVLGTLPVGTTTVQRTGPVAAVTTALPPAAAVVLGTTDDEHPTEANNCEITVGRPEEEDADVEGTVDPITIARGQGTEQNVQAMGDWTRYWAQKSCNCTPRICVDTCERLLLACAQAYK